ncbi:DNA-3-methyladenine glycosylase [Patescibacteria group bacterium]|nr:DNA-3-methyladenine glycosylase [Patescibacteria group bacterium]MBU1683401.1 DNA-3-methyladenine glycosylase [Patescibacteria group bacterium]MBU1934911.1 DNA-3-methyladenine glycosylase [Patescibacteria group bacterium]
MKKLKRSFFKRPTLEVTKELLGKVLVIGNCSGRINEVEAYIGQNDPACHACNGMTKRNEVMFGEAGHLYVYFCYGMYHCANIVTEKKGFPAAVLLRGVEPLDGKEQMKKRRGRGGHLSDGPGKLCIALGMAKKSHNGVDLCNNGKCYVYDDGFIPKNIKSSPRIGIKVGLNKKWRLFYQS